MVASVHLHNFYIHWIQVFEYTWNIITGQAAPYHGIFWSDHTLHALRTTKRPINGTCFEHAVKLTPRAMSRKRLYTFKALIILTVLSGVDLYSDYRWVFTFLLLACLPCGLPRAFYHVLVHRAWRRTQETSLMVQRRHDLSQGNMISMIFKWWQYLPDMELVLMHF